VLPGQRMAGHMGVDTVSMQKIKVMKINVDAQVRISAYFRVSSIPAVFFVKDKAVVLYLPGLRAEADYENAIKTVLAMKPELPDSTQKKQPSPALPAPPPAQEK
jgi:thioredoxin-like negative regulator of GroEL